MHKARREDRQEGCQNTEYTDDNGNPPGNIFRFTEFYKIFSISKIFFINIIQTFFINYTLFHLIFLKVDHLMQNYIKLPIEGDNYEIQIGNYLLGSFK